MLLSYAQQVAQRYAVLVLRDATTNDARRRWLPGRWFTSVPELDEHRWATRISGAQLFRFHAQSGRQVQ